MYTEHPAFHPPPADAVLWRYMDFTKFVSLLDKSALFFARADKLGDPFEGYLPHPNSAAARDFYEGHPDGYQTMLKSIKESSRFMLISCWHESDYESDAMWKLYSKNDNGIAIKTDFGSLANSFTSTPKVYIGRIDYIDYRSEFLPHNDLLSAFLCKRKSFEYEHEVRAIVQIPRPCYRNTEQKSTIDVTQDICDAGYYYEVNLSRLIQEVIVTPFCQDWFVQLIKSVATRYNLEVPVDKSTLADKPQWDYSSR